MRKFKFRAWTDSGMKYNVIPWQHDFVIGAGHWKCLSSDGLGWASFSVDGYSFKIIMQYIGLKDKNGKEIYEGDILQDVKMIKIRKDLAIYEIVFMGGSFCLKGSEETIPIFAYDGNSLDNMEIIGNIYENLELVR